MYKLLVVDDNNMHIKCVMDYADWGDMGFTEIRTASNGEEALEIFDSFEPDLVITDVVMPLMSGVELAENIRKRGSKVHIIFMSCHEEYNYVKNAIDNDITAYILKPLEPESFSETVRKVVRDIEERNKAVSSQKVLAEFLPLVRESLLYRMLYSMDFEISEELLANANLVNFGKAIITKYVFLDNDIDCNTIYKALSSIGTEFGNMFPNAIAELPNKLIILITSDSTNEEYFLEKVIEFTRSYMSRLSEEYGLKAIAGISSVSDSLKNVHQLLSQANLAIDSTYDLVPEEIYLYEDFQENDPKSPDYNIINLKEDLSQLLNKADTEAIDEFLNKYYPTNSAISKNTIKALCFSTVTTLQLLFSERNLDMTDLFENSDVIWQKLNKFETIQDTYHWLRNILLASCEFVLSHEDKNDMVSAIKKYIDNNYKDIISLSQIASELYISAGYARNVFKKSTGQTIFDYLVDRKIQEAKKLLQDPKYKIYEIQDLVGYTSKAHFIETFKRKTGMTPKEWRQNLSQ